MTTDEKKLEVIQDILRKTTYRDWMERFYPVCKEIFESLKQFDPDPLEVRLNHSFSAQLWSVLYINNIGIEKELCRSLEEKECIAFCNKHGLRVKE